MDSKKIYFISDLHLGAGYITDEHEAERRVVRFLESIRADAEAIYFMGDVLDYWFEYRTVAPRGYLRFFGELASLADSGIRLYWFIGNHDIWLFDYLRDELGVTVIDGVDVCEIKGKRFFLSHGDGVGELPKSFRFLRALFRNKLCQRLYAGIHPRWTVPLAHLWSKHNRHFGEYVPSFGGMDAEPLALFAKKYYNEVDPTINYFVFGHLHVLVDEPISPTCRFVVLGEWIQTFSYGCFDGNSFELRHYIDEKP